MFLYRSSTGGYTTSRGGPKMLKSHSLSRALGLVNCENTCSSECSCIGPPRAATPPPAEDRRCSSLTRCPELWAWSTAKTRAHLNVPVSVLHGRLHHLPRRTEDAQVSLVVPSFGLGQLRKHVLILSLIHISEPT